MSSRLLLFTLSFSFFLSLSVPHVMAQQMRSFDSIDSLFRRGYLDAVVITATRTPKALKNVPVPTRLIGDKEIERTDGSNVQEVLQQSLPGLEYTFNYSQQPMIDLQGFGGSSVLFLIDGVRMAGETMDNVDPYRLPLLGVGRIEVVKGASSLLYGSSAMGGVINLISNESNDPWNLRLNAKVGAHGEQRHAGLFSLHQGKVSSTTMVQYNSIDNINLLRPGQITAGELSEIIGNKSWNANERLVLHLNDRWDLTARGGFFFRERNTSLLSKDRYYDLNGCLSSVYRFATGSSMEATYSIDQYDKGAYDSAADYYLRNYRNRQHLARVLYSHRFDSVLTVSLGADFMHDYLQTYEFTDSGFHQQGSAALFAQSDWDITSHLSLLAGVRYDYFSAAQMHRITPRANLMYKIDHLNLRAGYANGFRAPSLKEMYMDFDMPAFWIYGNPDLKPELSHSLQASAEYYQSHFSVMAMVFHNIVENRISTAWFTNLGGHRYMNMDAMTISGLDCSAALHTDFGLTASLGYTYTHESIRKGLPINVSSRPHSAVARIDYDHRHKKWSYNVGISGRMLSTMECDEYNAVGDLTTTSHRIYPGYMLWRLQASVRHSNGIAISATIDNLFDYVPDYYYIKSPITTGRTFSVSLIVDIDKMW